MTYSIEASLEGYNSVVTRRNLVATPDPKREGMYKVTEYREYSDLPDRGFSYMYGKKHQAEIRKMFNIK